MHCAWFWAVFKSSRRTPRVAVAAGLWPLSRPRPAMLRPQLTGAGCGRPWRVSGWPGVAVAGQGVAPCPLVWLQLATAFLERLPMVGSKASTNRKDMICWLMGAGCGRPWLLLRLARRGCGRPRVWLRAPWFGCIRLRLFWRGCHGWLKACFCCTEGPI